MSTFGVPQQQISAQAAQSSLPAWARDIEKIRAAYVPGENCKFQEFVYEVVGVAPDLVYLGASHMDPRFIAGIKKQRRAAIHAQIPWVSKEKWERAEQSNPDRTNLTPALLIGIDALYNRVAQQSANTREQITMLVKKDSTSSDWFDSIDTNQTREAIERCRRRQVQLQQRLIRAMGRLERIELLAAGKSLMQTELNFNERLKSLKRSLDDPNSCKSQLAQIAAEQRTRDAILESGSENPRSLDDFSKISAQDEDSIFRFLDQQREGLERLTKILKRDIRDTRIIRERIADYNNR